MKSLTLPVMFFCHIVDDYYLQGVLAEMKQRQWWEDNTPNKMYKNDYLIALFEHGFSWSFMVLLPIFNTCININNFNQDSYILYFGLLFSNTIIHAIIDDMKANMKCINLIVDQLLHFVQIIASWYIWYNCG